VHSRLWPFRGRIFPFPLALSSEFCAFFFPKGFPERKATGSPSFPLPPQPPFFYVFSAVTEPFAHQGMPSGEGRTPPTVRKTQLNSSSPPIASFKRPFSFPILCSCCSNLLISQEPHFVTGFTFLLIYSSALPNLFLSSPPFGVVLSRPGAPLRSMETALFS